MANEDSSNDVVVRGRFRTWQFILLGTLVGLVIYGFMRVVLLHLALPLIVENFCTNGWFGFTRGWWYFIAVISLIPTAVLIGLWFYVKEALQVLRIERFPLPNKTPWGDTKLLTGKSARRKAAIDFVVSAILAILIVWMSFIFLEMFKSFGQNLTPTQTTKCLESVEKKRVP
jgi:hypothetical protein